MSISQYDSRTPSETVEYMTFEVPNAEDGGIVAVELKTSGRSGIHPGRIGISVAKGDVPTTEAAFNALTLSLIHI